MITCDSCGCSGTDIKKHEFYKEKEDDADFLTLDLCVACNDKIMAERYAILRSHLYVTPRPRTAVEYSLPPRGLNPFAVVGWTWFGVAAICMIVRGITWLIRHTQFI